MNYRIGIVDDKYQNLQSVVQEISFSTGASVMLTARNGEDFLSQLKHLPLEEHPHLVLMDIDMPVMDGITAVNLSLTLYPHIKFIMLTVVDDDDKLFEAIKAGASGYLLKEERGQSIMQAIKEAIEQDGAPMTPRIARKTLKLLSTQKENTQPSSDPVADILSTREIEILQAMVQGYDYKATGDKLFISPNTVRNHIAKIYEKLHIKSKSQAVKIAVKNRWV